jgi:Leu/Phe-tRNA-protein transferase
MTTSIGRIPVMAIKLHRERSIIDLRFLSPHVQNKTKKHSNRYRFAINADDGCFDRAVAMLDRRHKNNWMSSMLVQSLKRVYLTKPDELRMLVWEVWNREDVLVAVEIGYLHGKIYTSMSGAFEEDGAGSVQLAVTAGWLLQSNVLIWDFGMQMEYKQGLGAKTISRSEWLDCVAACGGKVKINPHESEKTECATLARTKKRFADIESLSVGELRHVAKLLKIDLHGLVEKGEMVNAVKSALNR